MTYEYRYGVISHDFTCMINNILLTENLRK